MNRLRAPLCMLLALGLMSLPATGQDAPKSSTTPKKPPPFVFEADDEAGGVKGTEVAPPPVQVTEIKQYPINFQGPSAKGVSVFVPKVVYFSDGRMRWYFSFWNRSEESQLFFFDFEESFIADEKSNPYPQVARHVISGNRGSILMQPITSDRRFDTWIDFKAPDRPTSKFKVGIMLEGRRDHRADAYRPFIVTLTEPLPPAVKPSRIAREGQEEGFAASKLDEFGETRPGGMTRPISAPGELEPPAKPTAAATEAVLASAKEGRKYEGSIRGADGYTARGGLHFEHRSDNRLLAATIYRHAQPARDIWLIGDFHSQRSAPGGLIIRFADFRKIEYTFTIDNKNVKGTDTEGNAYTFMFVKE